MKLVLAALVGATLQEFLHLYEVKGRFTMSIQKMIRSTSFWVLSLSMIIFSTLGTYFYYDGAPSVTAKDMMIMGAAFPLVFKKLVSAFIEQKPLVGGGGWSDVRRYF